jgi:anti-anti-sigma factor
VPTDVHLIAPAGELDISSVRALGAELAQAAGDATRPLVVDLSGVSFMDSSALGPVVRAHERLRRQGRPMAVVAPQGGPAAGVLDATGVVRRLRVFESRVDAVDAVEQPSS